MANYLNTLTDNPNIWIEENIYNNSELAILVENKKLKKVDKKC